MSDPKGKYIVETEGLAIPPEPLTGVRPPQRMNPALLPAAYQRFEHALDEAARRMKAGHKVRITRPDGSLMRHHEIISELQRRASRR